MASYSCIHCGAMFQAYPPDDIHTKSNTSDDAVDSVEMNYICTSCKKTNKLYWIKPIL